MQTNENYATAKTLATVTHHGETFRVVRRRINGKPWRKYVALVHGGTFVAGLNDGCTDPMKARDEFTALLTRTFIDRASLLASLTPILEKYAPGA